MEGFVIRAERPNEFSDIYDLVETAFKTAMVKDGTEQDFVDKLRASDGYIPELAMVAERSGTLLGHIMLTRVKFDADNGAATRALLLAPLSVLVEYRGQRVGAALMEEALRRAREAGFQAVFLVGDPAYYGRFGFVQSDFFGVLSDSPIPQQFILALELEAGSLSAGKVELIEG